MNFRRWKSVVRALLFAGLAAPTACRHDALDAPMMTGTIEPSDEPDVLELATEPAPFTVHTYEGSGQFIHPDVYVFPAPWQGHRYWYVATPYPGGVAEYENPSVFLNTAAGWDAPPRAINPIARPDAAAYLSDPDLEYDPASNMLRLYYRQTSPSNDRILVVSSAEGRRWSAPTTVLEGPRYGMISPAVTRETDGSWRMWSVDAEKVGCRAHRAELSLTERRSRDGLAWGAPTPVKLDIPRHVPWHLDVQYVPAKHEYWALVAAYPEGSNCSYTAVFFGRSTDGTTWRMSPTPLMAAGALAPLKALVYRSTFHYHAGSDAVTVWFTGAHLESQSYVYSGATARYPMAELLRRVEQPFDAGASIARSRNLGDDPAEQAARAARAAFVEQFP